MSVKSSPAGFFSFSALQLCSCGIATNDPSVRPSAKRVACDKTKKTSAHILIPYERLMHLVLQHEEWLVGDVPIYVKFWAKLTHPLQKGRLANDMCS